MEHKYQRDINRVSTLVGIPKDLTSMENRTDAFYKMIRYLMANKIDFSISDGPETEPLIRIGEVTRNTKRTDLAGMLAHVMCLSIFNTPSCVSCRYNEATRTIVQEMKYGSVTSQMCDPCFINNIPSMVNFSVKGV